MYQQIIEIHSAEENIRCPICQHAVVDWTEEQYIQPCEHTLFIAMDLGFEFVSDRFEEKMSRSVDQIHDDEAANVFQEILNVEFNDAILYANKTGNNGYFLTNRKWKPGLYKITLESEDFTLPKVNIILSGKETNLPIKISAL